MELKEEGLRTWAVAALAEESYPGGREPTAQYSNRRPDKSRQSLTSFPYHGRLMRSNFHKIGSSMDESKS